MKTHPLKIAKIETTAIHQVGLTPPDLTLHAGCLGTLPGPGFGFTLDPDAVERAAQRHRTREHATGGAW